MRILLPAIIVCAALLFTGCTDEQMPMPHSPRAMRAVSGFEPAQIELSRLSEISQIQPLNGKIRIYAVVHIEDRHGVKMKAPGKIRFELYQYQERTHGNMGARVYNWEQLDISNSNINQSYWQDSLRAYIFELEADYAAKETGYVLSATFVQGEDIRLSATRVIEYHGK